MNCISILYPEYFTIGKEAPWNGRSLDLNESFDFQPMT